MARKLIKTIVGNKCTVKVYFDVEYHEYVGRVEGDKNGDSDYFTDDREDALGTARIIAGPEEATE